MKIKFITGCFVRGKLKEVGDTLVAELAEEIAEARSLIRMGRAKEVPHDAPAPVASEPAKAAPATSAAKLPAATAASSKSTDAK
jgi:hypothetical protein